MANPNIKIPSNHKGHKFRKHALIRVSERAITHPFEILLRMNGDAFVPLGIETNGRRSHELLYLPEDAECFTVVRDLKSLEIITILPIYYHETCAWKISEAVLEEAKIVGDEYSASAAKIQSYVFRLVIRAEDQSKRSESLGRYRIRQCEILDDLMQDSNLSRTLLSRIRKKKIGFDEIRGLIFQQRESNESWYLPAHEWHDI